MNKYHKYPSHQSYIEWLSQAIFGFPRSAIGDKSQITTRSFKMVRLHHLKQISPISIKWYYNKVGCVFIELILFINFKRLMHANHFCEWFILKRCGLFINHNRGFVLCFSSLSYDTSDYWLWLPSLSYVSLYHCDTWSPIALSQCIIIYDVFQRNILYFIQKALQNESITLGLLIKVFSYNEFNTRLIYQITNLTKFI